MSLREPARAPALDALAPRTRNLLRAVDSMAALLAEQASLKLAELQGDIDLILRATNNFKNQAEAERELCTRKIGELDSRLAAMREQDEALRRDAQDLERRIAELDHANVALDEQQRGLQRELDDLSRRAGERAQKLEELKKWFWVPGYGQYLAIRTLVDNDIGELQSLQDSLSNVARGIGGNAEQRGAALANLASVRMGLNGVVNSRSNLERSYTLLQTEHLRFRHNWDFAVQAVGFWGELAAAAGTTREQTANVAVFLEYMARSAAVPAAEGSAIVYRPLREALLDFARLYDDAYDSLLNPMTTIASYPLLSNAQFEDVVGGNGPLRVTGERLVTPELATLDPERFTISVEFDPALLGPNAVMFALGGDLCVVALDGAGKPHLTYGRDQARESIICPFHVAIGRPAEAKLRYDAASRTLALFIDDDRACTAEVTLGMSGPERTLALPAGSPTGAIGNLRIKSAIKPN